MDMILKYATKRGLNGSILGMTAIDYFVGKLARDPERAITAKR